MCDYSLYALPNRLAEDGERVVLHRFGTGAIGFASVVDVPPPQVAGRSRWDAFRSGMKSLLLPRSCPGVPAVCMPPGTRLMMSEIPAEVQRQHCLRSGDTVVATEISSQSYAFRDALIIPNGKCILLQELPEGIQAVVLSTGVSEAETRLLEEIYVR
jgi:hypothetical protein